MFDIPTGYSCVTRQNDTTLYGYINNTRDTFTFNGLHWEKTATSSVGSSWGNQVCVEGLQVPSQIASSLLLVAGFVILAFFSCIWKTLMGTFNSYRR